MSQIPPNTRRSGIASFTDETEEVPVPTKEQIAAARAGGEKLGFHSDKPVPPASSAPAVPSGPAAESKRRTATLTANFHIRVRPEERERFDEFAYRHRLSKGEAMRMLIDLAETFEKQQQEATRAKD